MKKREYPEDIAAFANDAKSRAIQGTFQDQFHTRVRGVIDATGLLDGLGPSECLCFGF